MIGVQLSHLPAVLAPAPPEPRFRLRGRVTFRDDGSHYVVDLDCYGQRFLRGYCLHTASGTLALWLLPIAGRA